MDEKKIDLNDETKEKAGDETKISRKDKTKVNAADETKISSTEEMGAKSLGEMTSNQITAISPDPDQETVRSEETLDSKKRDTISQDKNSEIFSITDITRRLESEVANIPDDYKDQIEPEDMSHIIKSYLPGRTDEEKIRINRNFLKDAEPFRIEQLIEDIKKIPDGLLTGFESLDQLITIPPNAVTIITSRPKHGKTCFMLNMLLNMCRQYKEKHFLFYTYEAPKWEIMIKLLNMCGTKQFDQQEGIKSNLDRWKYEFKHTDIETLKKKANNDKEYSEYSGLKNFLDISPRIHLISSGHHIIDLVDSIQSFEKAFNVGAVFIDSLQKIHPGYEKSTIERQPQLQDISGHLRKLANETRFPLIVSALLTAGPKGSPEYDDLWEENVRGPGNPDQNADLILGLQNYSRSKFIGSNVNNNFQSKFYGQPLKKAEPMPENLKDMMQKTIILVKVIANKTGPEPEVELIFHKELLTISDF
jgi:replicative DNA helicase